MPAPPRRQPRWPITAGDPVSSAAGARPVGRSVRQVHLEQADQQTHRRHRDTGQQEPERASFVAQPGHDHAGAGDPDQHDGLGDGQRRLRRSGPPSSRAAGPPPGSTPEVSTGSDSCARASDFRTVGRSVARTCAPIASAKTCATKVEIAVPSTIQKARLESTSSSGHRQDRGQDEQVAVHVGRRPLLGVLDDPAGFAVAQSGRCAVSVMAQTIEAAGRRSFRRPGQTER